MICQQSTSVVTMAAFLVFLMSFAQLSRVPGPLCTVGPTYPRVLPLFASATIGLLPYT